MTTAQNVLDVAISQVGYAEGRNNDNKFGQWYGVNNAPWCAEFVSWAFYTAFHANGEKSPLEGIQNDKGAAYTPFVVNWAKKAGLWRPDPQVGRLVLFDWNKDGTSDHIGICRSPQDGAGNYLTVEGNTSHANQANGGEVQLRTRSNTQGYSMGFVDISYTGAPAAPAPGSPPPPPHAAAPPWPGRMIALSSPLMRGNDVMQWQRQMKARGWKIGTDGVYGPESHTVCEKFQGEKGVKVDGVVGPVTWQLTWTSPVT